MVKNGKLIQVKFRLIFDVFILDQNECFIEGVIVLVFGYVVFVDFYYSLLKLFD